MIEHCLEPFPADVTACGSVNGIAKRHVVSRHRFSDGSGSATDVEKPPRNFLPSADLGKRSIPLRVEIDLERLFVGVDVHLRVHV